MDFQIEIAGLTIQVNSIYLHIYRKCKGFISDPAVKADISVGTTMAQLRDDYNRLLAETDEGTMFWNLECIAVHRQIAGAVIEHDTLLIHGAAIAYDGGAYLFCAPSGTGKTTHIRLWLENLPEAYVVNGDKPFLRLTENGVFVCGSPWCGKENLGTNTMVPLKAVIFMERSERNHIQEVPFSGVFSNLLQQVFRPADADGMRKTLKLLTKLSDKVQFYRFQFNNYKDDCFDVAYNALIGGQS